MKHIKDFGEKKFWCIPTDDRFLKAALKINLSKQKIKEYFNLAKIYQVNFIYVGFDFVLRTWYWDIEPFSQDFEFMGYVNMEEYEVTAKQYNL